MTLGNSSENSSRKDRYKVFDQPYEFTAKDKLTWLGRVGGPIVLGVGILLILVVAGWRFFRRETAVDRASLDETKAALALISQAAKANGEGNDILAVETLRTVVRQYPRTAASEQAAEMLARYERGEPLFQRAGSVATGASATSAASLTLEQPEVAAATAPSRDPLRRRDGGTVAGDHSVSTKDSLVEELGLQSIGKEEQASILAEIRRPASLELRTKDERRGAKQLPSGFDATPDSQIHRSGWPTVIRCLKDRSTMLLIPPPSESKEEGDVGPTYYMDRFEVTRGAFATFIKETKRDDSWTNEERQVMRTDFHPAVFVSADDAAAFAEWAGKSIPEEDQWVRALGKEASDASSTRPTSAVALTAVASAVSDRSPFGIFNLHGNAAEWTATTLGGDRGPDTYFVVRGGLPEGGFWRQGLPRATRSPEIGFRTVLVVEQGSIANTKIKPAGRSGRSPSDATSETRGNDRIDKIESARSRTSAPSEIGVEKSAPTTKNPSSTVPKGRRSN